ncbi:MAG: hypothetical protein LBE75_09465 [Burkholderiales bacterium]|jgi:hypothetical protein|nr:hypothetical protein [Burkholderiales bacterium]
MDNAILLHADGKRSLFENKRVFPLLDYPKIESPVYVLSDFEGAVSGVSVLNSKSSYAESLIARRLRDDGLIDGEVKVLVHRGAQTDGGYQVLYTAVPKGLWQNMQSWVSSQKEHCLLIPKTALMYDLLSGGNGGVIFRSGRRFSLLMRQQKVMDCFSVLALSDSEEDLRIAARTLAERARKRQPEGSEPPLKWNWYSLGAASAGEEDSLARVFKEIAGAQVVVADTEAYAKKGGGHVYTSLPTLALHFSEKLAVNSLGDKISYFAENHLMRIACGIGAIAAGLFVLGLWSLLQARIITTQAGQNVLETQKIAQSLQEETTPTRQDKQFYATRDFVGLAAKAQGGVDPYSFLRSLRSAAGDNVQILRVQIQPENNSLIVEGWVEQSGGSDKPLADFVEQLRGLGFSPKAIDAISSASTRRSGAFAYRLQPMSDEERAGK